MAAPSVAGGFADYYDGESAARQRVRLSYDEGEYGPVLEIELPDGEHLVLWPVSKVRTLADQASYDVMVLGLQNGGSARLVVRDPGAAALVVRVCPNAAIPIKPKRSLPRTVLRVAISVALVAAIFKLYIPFVGDRLASFVGPETEVALGEAAYTQYRTIVSAVPGEAMAECNAPDGLAAYQKLLDRIHGGLESPFTITATVWDDSRVPAYNAFALPGGRVVFFESLLQMADTPEEIAAVMAHEIGHVHYSHGVSRQFQAYAVLVLSTLLFSDVGVVGIGLANSYISSSYSRAAEVEADEFAQQRMLDVGLPPAAMGSLFDKLRALTGDQPSALAHFSTHPQLEDRINAARAFADPGGAPVLTPDEWRALQNICGRSTVSDTARVAAISR